MNKHTAISSNFRLATWPYGGGYITTFSNERYNFELKPVFDYLKQELGKVAQAFVHKSTFTLLNIYSGYTYHSVGSSPAPDKQVFRGPVSFTFSMTLMDGFDKPSHQFWNGRTCVWSISGRNSPDFITISLPPDLSARARMYNMMDYDQIGLYNIVGGLTKAFVREKPVTRAEIFGTTIPHAMSRYAISDWQYVLDFWKRMPELLELNLDAEFLDYWHNRIAPVYTPPAEYMELVVDAFRSFLLRYRSGTMTKADQRLAYLVAEEDLTDMEAKAKDLAGGLM